MKEQLIILCLLLSLIFLILCIVKKKQEKENFKRCICSSEQGGRESVCRDIENSEVNYENGTETEFSKFKDKDWNTVSPGDLPFPLSQNCGWGNYNNGKDKFWDYTDFGS